MNGAGVVTSGDFWGLTLGNLYGNTKECFQYLTHKDNFY